MAHIRTSPINRTRNQKRMFTPSTGPGALTKIWKWPSILNLAVICQWISSQVTVVTGPLLEGWLSRQTLLQIVGAQLTNVETFLEAVQMESVADLKYMCPFNLKSATPCYLCWFLASVPTSSWFLSQIMLEDDLKPWEWSPVTDYSLPKVTDESDIPDSKIRLVWAVWCLRLLWMVHDGGENIR